MFSLSFENLSEIEICKYGLICVLFFITSTQLLSEINIKKQLGRTHHYLFALIFIVLVIENLSDINKHFHSDGIMSAAMNILSNAYDGIKYCLHYLTNTTSNMEYKTMLRYENTIHNWECGANYFQTHIIGTSTSLFFPKTSLDEINSCCHDHDLQYCCQIGRQVADQQFYQCLRESCKEWYCSNVINTYETLLNQFGQHAYSTMHNCENAVC